MDKRQFREQLNKAKRIVVKIGSAVIVKNSALNMDVIGNIVDNIAYISKSFSKQVVLVSSGAVASGMSAMGLKKRPDNIVHQQALAAVGQPLLMDVYRKLFAKHNINVSQVLITIDDIQNRRRFINAKNSVSTLIKWNSLPIVNENDTVVIKELRFGDNDSLASHMVNLTEADALIMLTNVDGVFDKNPNKESASLVESIKKGFDLSYLEGISALGSGGIKSKVEAGLRVAQLGKLAVITNGTKKDALRELFENENSIKTFFEPYNVPMASKKSWISNTTPSGVLVVDDGAQRSIKSNKSLLASGIVKVYGSFGRGDIINIESDKGVVIAKGIANYDAYEIEKIKGRHSSLIVEVLGYKYSNDVVHINNMVVVK